MKPNAQLEDAVAEQRTHRNRCPDYDDDCRLVKCPLACYLGDALTGRAEGYCPLLLGIPECNP
jgi:hypothetical protein